MAMMNPYKIKKYSALLLIGFLPASVMYSILLLMKDVWWSLGGYFITLLFTLIFSIALLSNPFTRLLEGKGMLLLTLDSTGQIVPFNVSLDSKRDHVFGRVFKNPFRAVFDRNTIFDFKTPTEAAELKEEGEDLVICRIPKAKANQARFQFGTFPTFIFNPQLGTFYTKDWFGNEERLMYANHLLLYLNKKMEELTSLIRDFARYIAEQLKPKIGFGGGWMWVIIIVIILILGALAWFAWPAISGAFGQAAGNPTDIIPSGGAIIPK